MLNFELVQLKNGTSTVQDREVQESMHSLIGSWEEAMQIYVQQAQLTDRLTCLKAEPLVIYDVGLGICANALATFDTFLKIKNKRRSLKLVSFENNLNGIKFALENSHAFPFIQKFKASIETLLKEDFFREQTAEGISFEWILYKQDYISAMSFCQFLPEIIYYDFYSPKTSPNLWDLNSFLACYRQSYGAMRSDFSTQLFTYCSSTAVRSALLLAGFYVGQGVETQAKKETTVASTCYDDLKSPLSLSWLEHLKRSSKPFPEDVVGSEIQNVWLTIERQLMNPGLDPVGKNVRVCKY